MHPSNRANEWTEFAIITKAHIENYTVPQYGDSPNDQVEEWSITTCAENIKRYANRIGSSRRGKLETLRDMVKIAHYACLILGKLQPTLEEINAIVEGRSLEKEEF